MGEQSNGISGELAPCARGQHGTGTRSTFCRGLSGLAGRSVTLTSRLVALQQKHFPRDHPILFKLPKSPQQRLCIFKACSTRSARRPRCVLLRDAPWFTDFKKAEDDKNAPEAAGRASLCYRSSALQDLSTVTRISSRALGFGCSDPVTGCRRSQMCKPWKEKAFLELLRRIAVESAPSPCNTLLTMLRPLLGLSAEWGARGAAPRAGGAAGRMRDGARGGRVPGCDPSRPNLITIALHYYPA